MVDRQMQRHQGRDAGRRQILGEVVAMAVHKVDQPLLQCLLDPLPVLLLSPVPEPFGELRRKRTGGNQFTGRLGARTGDDHGAVALRNQSSVERRKHLFRASGSIGTHRRKNIGDVENCQTHRGAHKPSASSAPWA